MRIVYKDVGPDGIGSIRPMWEKLRAHHAGLSEHFSSRRLAFSFDNRQREFLDKARAGKLWVDLACFESDQVPIGYCVASLSHKLDGEVDSLFVEEPYRGHGIGSELMRRAMAWLAANKAVSTVISVVDGNDDAISFYTRFGFLPDNIILRQTAT